MDVDFYFTSCVCSVGGSAGEDALLVGVHTDEGYETLVLAIKLQVSDKGLYSGSQICAQLSDRISSLWPLDVFQVPHI